MSKSTTLRTWWKVAPKWEKCLVVGGAVSASLILGFMSLTGLSALKDSSGIEKYFGDIEKCLGDEACKDAMLQEFKKQYAKEYAQTIVDMGKNCASDPACRQTLAKQKLTQPKP